MGTGRSINLKQMLFVIIVFFALLVIAVVVIHAATPHLFHTLTFRPQFINHH